MAARGGNQLRGMMDEGPARRRRRFQLVADVYSELSKVTWPSRNDAIRLTGLVLVVAAVIGAFLSLWDYGFSQLFEQVFL